MVRPKDVQDALRAILLSDTYLEALASFIPENRKLLLHYEDFLSSPPSFVGRLYAVLAPPKVGDQVTYVDETKIQRNATAPKRRAVAEFSSWLMENYHEVENGMEADADDARSEAEDQVLFYEKKFCIATRS